MIISDAQAKLVTDCLRTPHACEHLDHSDIDPDLMERARVFVAQAPDLRPDRVEEARHRLADEMPSAHEVAEKMLSRIAADSLR